MNTEITQLSEDQAEAFDRVAEVLRPAGIDIENGLLQPPQGGANKTLAITGKAGSGKTLLLAAL